MKVDGKTIFVTGGGSGIGLAIAEKLINKRSLCYSSGTK